MDLNPHCARSPLISLNDFTILDPHVRSGGINQMGHISTYAGYAAYGISSKTRGDPEYRDIYFLLINFGDVSFSNIGSRYAGFPLRCLVR